MADVREKLGRVKGISVEIGQPISHRSRRDAFGHEGQHRHKLFGDDLNRMFAIGQDIKQKISGVDGNADPNLEPQIRTCAITDNTAPGLWAKYGIRWPEYKEFIDVALAGGSYRSVRPGKKCTT